MTVTICQALSFLNVELLIIPAILKLKETWINSFGFEHLDSRSKRMIKSMNLMVFDGTITLQKKIPKPNFPDENLIPTRGFWQTLDIYIERVVLSLCVSQTRACILTFCAFSFYENLNLVSAQYNFVTVSNLRKSAKKRKGKQVVMN